MKAAVALFGILLLSVSFVAQPALAQSLTVKISDSDRVIQELRKNARRHGVRKLTGINQTKDCTASIKCPNGGSASCAAFGPNSACVSQDGDFVMCQYCAPGPDGHCEYSSNWCKD
jgi:hypothetical protein